MAVKRAVSEADGLVPDEGEVVPLTSPSKLMEGRSDTVLPEIVGAGESEALPVEEDERVLTNPREDEGVEEGGRGVKDEKLKAVGVGAKGGEGVSRDVWVVAKDIVPVKERETVG